MEERQPKSPGCVLTGNTLCGPSNWKRRTGARVTVFDAMGTGKPRKRSTGSRPFRKPVRITALRRARRNDYNDNVHNNRIVCSDNGDARPDYITMLFVSKYVGSPKTVHDFRSRWRERRLYYYKSACARDNIYGFRIFRSGVRNGRVNGPRER